MKQLDIFKNFLAILMVLSASMMLVACSTTDEEEAPVDTGPTDAEQEILDDML